MKKEQIFNLLPLSMLLEIVKIISGNITVHATFVGCVFGKIQSNESHLAKRLRPNLQKLFATVSFAERRQNTSDIVLDASVGAIVLPVKVVHPSF